MIESMRSRQSEQARLNQAARLQRAHWRDPRLALGLLLVAASVVVGARAMAAADRTVVMPVAAFDLAAGMAVDASALQERRVLMSGPHPYVEGAVPDGYVLTSPVSAGELLPRAALVPAEAAAGPQRLVTVAVPSNNLPAGVERGRVVDVYRTSGDESPAVLLVRDVTVEQVSRGAGGFGVHGDTVPVTLSLRQTGTAAAFDALLADVISAGARGGVVLVLVPHGHAPAGGPAAETVDRR